jgi:hypothetical protein
MKHYLLNFQLWVDVAQVITALFTLIGVILSFWFSRNTLKEVQRERWYGQRPYLLFQYGGRVISIDFKKHEDGKVYVQILWPSAGQGIIIPTLGELKNYGTGPAIDVNITWVVEKIYTKNAEILIDENKRKELQYSSDRNTNPIMATHLLPSQESGIHLMPFFISADFDRAIKRADGYLIIKYSDTFGHNHETYQKFHVFTHYETPERGFHTTFSDLMASKSNYH